MYWLNPAPLRPCTKFLRLLKEQQTSILQDLEDFLGQEVMRAWFFIQLNLSMATWIDCWLVTKYSFLEEEEEEVHEVKLNRVLLWNLIGFSYLEARTSALLTSGAWYSRDCESWGLSSYFSSFSGSNYGHFTLPHDPLYIGRSRYLFGRWPGSL